MKKLTKYDPIRRFTIREDGLFGSFYQPERDLFPGKAMVAKRLERKGFPYPFLHKKYETVSHYLSPVRPLSANAFRVERKFPDVCDASREAAWQDTLQFLRAKW